MIYTKKLIEILNLAKEEASKRKHIELEPIHFLYACLIDGKNYVETRFSNKGLLDSSINSIEENLKSFPSVGNGTVINSIELEKILSEADSKLIKDEKLGLKEVFDILRFTDNEFLKNIIDSLKLTPEDLIETEADAMSESSYLDRFCFDFINEVKAKEERPFLGRKNEINTIFEVMSKKYKNCPIITGESGVGKTAIVQKIASLIDNGQAPMELKNRKVYRLNNTKLHSNEHYVNSVKGIAEELKSENAILFIDDANIFFEDNTQNGIFDILKEDIKNNLITLILSSTDENNISSDITNDKSLGRLFQKIAISEPSAEDTLSMLRLEKNTFEKHHGVKIMDESLVETVELAKRYISGQKFPYKAIDLLDQVCANVKLKSGRIPPELDIISSKIANYELAIKSLVEDNKNSNKTKIVKIEKEIEKLKIEEEKVGSDFRKDDEIKKEIKAKKDEISKLEKELDKAISMGDMEKAARIKNGDLPVLNSKLEEIVNSADKNVEQNIVLKEDVFNVIYKRTGIPVAKLGEKENEKYLNVANVMKKRLFGQDQVIESISKSLLFSAAGLAPKDKPKGVFLLVGPSGVGKTETAKALASALFDDERKMIRFDMNAFQQSHQVETLLGSPPGFTGHDQGGLLTNAISNSPYSVILLDEIDKAHPDIMNVFLQIIDEGRATDRKGIEHDFSNSIIIMTSNYGAEYLVQENSEENRAKAFEKISMHLKPEFINRIDEIIYFNNLTKEAKLSISNRYLEEYRDRVSSQDIEITWDELVLEKITKDYLEGDKDGRTIAKYLKDTIGVPLSNKLLSNPDKDKIVITVENDNYKVDIVNEQRKVR